MSFLLGQEQADAGLTGLGSEFEFGTDAAGAFVHDVQADVVAGQALKMLGIEAAAVVGNRHHEIAAVVDFDAGIIGELGGVVIVFGSKVGKTAEYVQRGSSFGGTLQQGQLLLELLQQAVQLLSNLLATHLLAY